MHLPPALVMKGELTRTLQSSGGPGASSKPRPEWVLTTGMALGPSRAGRGPSRHSSDSGRKWALNTGGSRNHSGENLPPRVS